MKSKYQPLLVAAADRFKAASLTLPIPKPGGTPKHFWELAKHTSSPHWSTFISVPPMELTASTNRSLPCFFTTSASFCNGFITPMLVSLWVMATASTSRLLNNWSSRRSAWMGSPSGAVSISTVFPFDAATSANRLPKLPLTQQSILASTQFLTAPSIKPVPVLENRKT